MKTLTRVFLALALLYSVNLMAQSEFASPMIGIGVVCPDLDKSMEFYLEVIGMSKVSEFEVNEDFGKSSGLSDGLAFHVDVLKLEDSPEANVWKLVSYHKEIPHQPSKYVEDASGMQYITLHVKQLKPFVERINRHGVKFLGETPVLMADGRRSFALVQAPEGTIIELIGPME